MRMARLAGCCCSYLVLVMLLSSGTAETTDIHKLQFELNLVRVSVSMGALFQGFINHWMNKRLFFSGLILPFNTFIIFTIIIL